MSKQFVRHRFSLLAVLASFTLVQTACTSPKDSIQSAPSSSKIVGGLTVNADLPLANSTVFVLNSDLSGEPQYNCTGSVISRDLILTAAHCVTVVNPDAPALVQTVYFGNIKLRSNSIDPNLMYNVTESRVEPRWMGPLARTCDGNALNDIALLKLSKPLPPGYSPTPIAQSESIYFNGMPTIAEGFGIPSKEVGYVNQLFASTLEYDGPQISGQVAMHSTINYGMTPGDSGGPGATWVDGQFKIFGVVSNHCTDGQFEYFESVPPHLDWLRAAAKEMGADSNF